MPEFELGEKRPRVHPDVQDTGVIHCSRDLPPVVGRDVTIGHQACLEGCTVEAGVPAQVMKPLSGSSAAWTDGPADHYRETALLYRQGLRPPD